MPVRGIRGATTAGENTQEAILESSTLLLKKMIEKNQVIIEEICSIFFSVTPDLDKEFPAKSAREIGLRDTPLICMTEIPVEGDVSKCIRILIHLNTNKAQKEMRPVYLGGAKALRPDLAEE
jgi:chorismate mutase